VEWNVVTAVVAVASVVSAGAALAAATSNRW